MWIERGRSIGEALLCALLSCSLGAQVPAHRVLPPEVEAALEPVHGGRGMWAWFAEFARDPERQPWREEEWRRREKQGLSDAMAAAAVCGLWSDDVDVAYGAACHVPELALGLPDIDRYVDLVRPHLFDEDPRFDWDTFKHVLTPEQVADVLRARPRPESAHRQIFIGDLHRSFRSEHVPLLCARVADPDPIVRKDAFESLLNLLRYGSGSEHTDLVLDTLLAWPGESAFEVGDYEDPATWPAYEPRRIELAADREGLCPAPLAALLERWLVELRNEPAHGALGAWLLRQAEQVEFGGAADVELVAKLIQDGARPGPWIGVRAALRCEEVRKGPVLDALRAVASSAELREEGDGVNCALAEWALGDVDGLRARCLTDASAATVLLAQRDEAALQQLATAALQEGEAEGRVAMEFLVDVIEDAAFEPVLLPSDLEDQIGRRAEVAVAHLDGARLAALLERCPGARRRALVMALLERIVPEDVTRELLALFEVTDASALRPRLAAWREAATEESDLAEMFDEAWQALVEDEGDRLDVESLRREVLRPGGDVQEAWTALAAAGDDDARQVMAEVRRRHLYGWVDSNASRWLTEGFELAHAPYWIDELETICCRRNGAAEVVEALLGVDALDHPEWGLRTQGASVRAFFEARRAQLRMSRIAGRWVVGPSD